MNRQVFATPPAPVADTRNTAGAPAYSLTNEMALLQLATTGVFNDTYYVSAEKQLATVLQLCGELPTEWIARVAIYARQRGLMKDMPALLVAYLSTRPEKDIFHYTFDQVIDNIGMARNFVQVIRSGTVTRKSHGTAPKKAVARLLNRLSADKVFFQSAGTEPSLADVIRLTHPKPLDAEHDALFGYLLDKQYQFANLPASVRAFEDFKAGRSTEIPNVDFRRLTALPLSDEQWMRIGFGMTWNQLRMNLNTLARHNCFKSPEFTSFVATRLRDVESIAKLKVLPFALYSAIQALDPEVPATVRASLGFALDQTYLNAPKMGGDTLILVDSSGSMVSNRVTGNRGSATTDLTCVTAASFFAASLFKTDPDHVTVIPFDTTVHPITLNPRDSVESITKVLARNGGGTDVSCGIRWATNQQRHWSNILIISDNESWFDGRGRDPYARMGQDRRTATAAEWNTYKRAAGTQARLACWDLVPNTTTQVKDDRSVLNIGGFSESVYDVVADFFSGTTQDALRARLNGIPVR